MIAQALRNLKECNNTRVALGIYDVIDSNVNSGLDLTSYRTGYGSLMSYRISIPLSQDPHSTMDAICRAATREKFQIKHLAFEISPDVRRPSLETAFSTVTSNSPPNLVFLPNMNITFMLRRTKKAGGIRVCGFRLLDSQLEIFGDRSRPKPPISRRFDFPPVIILVLTVTQPPVEEIILRDEKVYVHELIHFLSIGVLRTLMLENIRIVSGNQVEFFTALRSNLNGMECLVLHRLLYGQRSEGVLFSQRVMWKGAANIRAGLDEAIAKM